MKDKKIKINNSIIYEAYESILRYGLSLIIGQSFFIGFSFLVLAPFINGVLRLALVASGFSYITLNNVGEFLLYPITMLLMLILFVILGLFFLFEGVYLTTYFSIIKHKHKPKLIPTLYLATKKYYMLLKNRNFTLLPITWLITIVFNIPLIAFAVRKIRILRMAMDEIKMSSIKTYIFYIVVTFVLLYSLKKIYLLSYCMIKKIKYKESRGCLKYIKPIDWVNTASYFIVWNVCIALVIYMVYFITTSISAILIVTFTKKALVIATFLTITERLISYLAVVIFMINTIANYSLITVMFYKFAHKANHIVEVDEYSATAERIIPTPGWKNKIIDHTEPLQHKRFSNRRIALLLVLSLVVVNSLYMYDMLRNGSPLEYINFDKIKVTSHRGVSRFVPENTIPAITSAMEELADYIEIDIRQTKDGELVLLHDDNLRRTTGINKKVWEIDSFYLSTLDAGRWFDEAFIDTKVPTLREVFELCKGRVMLNLDIKYNVNYLNFEYNIVNLIEEYDMELQCVVSSTQLSAINKIKELNPNIKTGYIGYEVNKNYYTNDNVDFFSLNSYFITEKILQLAHSSGKEVHAWTVNTRNELERMKTLGVNNIITDNPAYAKEILFQEESDPLFLTMLKLMLKY